MALALAQKGDRGCRFRLDTRELWDQASPITPGPLRPHHERQGHRPPEREAQFRLGEDRTHVVVELIMFGD